MEVEPCLATLATAAIPAGIPSRWLLRSPTSTYACRGQERVMKIITADQRLAEKSGVNLGGFNSALPATKPRATTNNEMAYAP